MDHTQATQATPRTKLVPWSCRGPPTHKSPWSSLFSVATRLTALAAHPLAYGLQHSHHHPHVIQCVLGHIFASTVEYLKYTVTST